MKKVLKDFPNLQKQLQELHSLFIQLKKRRKIIIPPQPIGNKKKDVYHHLAHYINIIHLKLIHQLHLLIIGINSENPEAASIIRSCIETMGALAFITRKIAAKKDDYQFVWETLYKATMGQNTKTMSKEITFSKAPQIFHSADYVREINELLDSELTKIKSKNKDYILKSYDFFCEYTHPNYLALQSYWSVDTGELIYDKKISCLKEDDLGQMLFTIISLILVYEMTLRKSEKLEREFK